MLNGTVVVLEEAVAGHVDTLQGKRANLFSAVRSGCGSGKETRAGK